MVIGVIGDISVAGGHMLIVCWSHGDDVDWSHGDDVVVTW